jgi:chromate reductase, NAD(P)H dehydrogenase (quinone)
MAQIKVLAFAGSLRQGSLNKKLVKQAAKGAEAAGAQVTYIDLRDFNIPVYDGDLEEKVVQPEGGFRLKKLFDEHDGFLLSTPEYNSSIPGALKNVIDWLSRQVEGERVYQQFEGKVCVLMSASPGAFGAVRSATTTRAILSHIQTIVIPPSVNLPHADQAFNEDGTLKDPKMQARVEKLGRQLVETIAQLKK